MEVLLDNARKLIMTKTNTTTSKVLWTFPLEIIAAMKAIADREGVKPSVLATRAFREFIDRNRTISIPID